MTSITSCIVGKKIRAIGPGSLELFPFVVLAIKLCIFHNNFYTRFQILIKFVLHMHQENKGHGAGPLELFPFVCCSCY